MNRQALTPAPNTRTIGCKIMLPLQTVEAHGIPTTEYCYDPEPQDTDAVLTIDDEITYLSTDPGEVQTGLHLRLALLEADTNKRLTVDVLCQSKQVCKALVEACHETFRVFPPADFVITYFWLVEDAPF